ncbi:MAG: aminotransferase class V-fold PLP-dependent enzyme [Ekhidna sp.]
MIYLNNAGTTWPKPEVVNKAIADFNRLTPDQWLAIFKEGQEVITSCFGIENSNRFLFTQSCTQSLAIAFSDFPWERGDRLIISTMEHHALSRWYYKLQQERGVEGVIIPRGEEGPIDVSVLEKELKKGARMVAMSMASNVTGEVFPYEEIVRLSKYYGTKCLLDGAQTAGVLPINLSELDPDIFVFAGHKGPFGTQGIGGLYISEDVSMICPSAACEIAKDEKSMTVFPTYCDTGSATMMTISGLTAGIKWIEQKGWDSILLSRETLVKKMRKELSDIEGIEIVGAKNYDRVTGAVSIKSTSVSLEIIKDQLWSKYQVKGSHGFQCAPLAHEALGTSDYGTLRFSLGPFNTLDEVEILIEGLKEILKISKS